MYSEMPSNIFGNLTDEYLHFEKVTKKLSNKYDLHMFILLDKLFPTKLNIVDFVIGGKICVSVTPQELWDVSTSAQLLELHRCGLLHDSKEDVLWFHY